MLHPTVSTPRINLHAQYQSRKLIVVGQKSHEGEGVQETMAACDKGIRSDSTKDRDKLACPSPVKVMVVADPRSATSMDVLYERRYRSKSQRERDCNERVEEEGNMADFNLRRGVNFVADSDEFAI